MTARKAKGTLLKPGIPSVLDSRTQEVTEALVRCRGNITMAAMLVGIPRSTMREWVGRNGVPRERRQYKTEEHIAQLEDKALMVLDELDEFRTPSEMRDLAVAEAILIDKGLLLKGKPTEIIYSREERIELLDVGDRLLEALEIKRKAMAGSGERPQDVVIETT